jgi:hypothetical protein
MKHGLPASDIFPVIVIVGSLLLLIVFFSSPYPPPPARSGILQVSTPASAVVTHAIMPTPPTDTPLPGKRDGTWRTYTSGGLGISIRYPDSLDGRPLTIDDTGSCIKLHYGLAYLLAACLTTDPVSAWVDQNGDGTPDATVTETKFGPYPARLITHTLPQQIPTNVYLVTHPTGTYAIEYDRTPEISAETERIVLGITFPKP